MFNKVKCIKPLACLFKENPYKEVNEQELIDRMLRGEEINIAELGVKEYILESGRSSGKTTTDEIAAVLDLVSPIKGDVWYCRSESNTIRSTILEGMLQAITLLGFTYGDNNSYDFRLSLSPFSLTHNKTGNVCQFFAFNKSINRTKGKIPPNKKLKRLMVEEANECDSGIFIDALISTAVKFFSWRTKVVFRLNPALTRSHWSIEYFNKRERAGGEKIYTTWEMLAKNGLLSPATVAEIIKMKNSDPLYYRYWYLGELINMQGLVFPSFTREKNMRRIDMNLVANFVKGVIIGGDAANKNDATAFGLIAILTDGNLLLLDSFYYDPIKEGKQLDDVELAEKICFWWANCKARYHGIQNKFTRGICDNANWNLIQMLQQSREMGYFQWIPATDKNILRDTNRLRTLFRDNTLLIADNSYSKNHEIIKEIENYVYDEKTNEIKRNQSDHGIDMLKYATLIYADTKQFFRGTHE